MKRSGRVVPRPLSAEQQLTSLISRLKPMHRTLIRSVRRAMRKRFPSANELAYDYPTSVVIGYSPTERGIESVVAISSSANGLRLYFNQGPKLPDPQKILRGSGKQTRFIRIESPGTLKLPEVEALLEAATDRAKTILRPGGRGRLIIK